MSTTPDNPLEGLERTAEMLDLLTWPAAWGELFPQPSPLESLLGGGRGDTEAMEKSVSAIERYLAAKESDADELRREIADLRAALPRPPEPTEPPQGQASAPLPGSGPIPRRERLGRIIGALRELDPDLDLAAMPGTKADLLELCQAADTPPKQFSISLRTFDNCISGWLQFAGRKPGITYYYRNHLPALRNKLA